MKGYDKSEENLEWLKERKEAYEATGSFCKGVLCFNCPFYEVDACDRSNYEHTLKRIKKLEDKEYLRLRGMISLETVQVLSDLIVSNNFCEKDIISLCSAGAKVANAGVREEQAGEMLKKTLAGMKQKEDVHVTLGNIRDELKNNPNIKQLSFVKKAKGKYCLKVKSETFPALVVCEVGSLACTQCYFNLKYNDSHVYCGKFIYSHKDRMSKWWLFNDYWLRVSAFNDEGFYILANKNKTKTVDASWFEDKVCSDLPPENK